MRVKADAVRTFSPEVAKQKRVGGGAVFGHRDAACQLRDRVVLKGDRQKVLL